MKANELMIGDWVYNPFTRKTLRLTFGRDLDLAEELCLEPIPLTEEILEKNGFEELMSDGKGVAAMLGRKSEHTRVWMYCIPGTFDSVSYVPERKLLQLKIMEVGMAYLHNLQYVHELQHFLRLFGIEKEIIL